MWSIRIRFIFSPTIAGTHVHTRADRLTYRRHAYNRTTGYPISPSLLPFCSSSRVRMCVCCLWLFNFTSDVSYVMFSTRDYIKRHWCVRYCLWLPTDSSEVTIKRNVEERGMCNNLIFSPYPQWLGYIIFIFIAFVCSRNAVKLRSLFHFSICTHVALRKTSRSSVK